MHAFARQGDIAQVLRRKTALPSPRWNQPTLNSACVDFAAIKRIDTHCANQTYTPSPNRPVFCFLSVSPNVLLFLSNTTFDI